MNKIILNDKEYSLPSEWSEVSARQTIQIWKLNDKDFSNIKRIVELIHILTGAEMDDLRRVKIEDISKVDIGFLTKKIPIGTKVFEIDGQKYGIERELQKMDVYSFADCEHYSKLGLDYAHNLASILIRPVIKQEGDLYILQEYDSEDAKLRAESFLDKLTAIELATVSNFFQDSVSGYIKNMTDSLQKQEEEKKVKKENQMRDFKDGAGLV